MDRLSREIPSTSPAMTPVGAGTKAPSRLS